MSIEMSNIITSGVGRAGTVEKITVTNFVDRRKNCDDKVENREKMCFKISGANGVLDIYWDIFKSSRFYYF